MTFKNEISVGDIIATAGFLVAAVGLFLTLRQLRQDSIRKRAEFIVSVFNQYITDADTSHVFYLIEYDDFNYGPEFHNSPLEQNLDRLLNYFEKIAVLYNMELVTRDDLELIKYEFVRIYQNDAVQNYFKTLDKLPKMVGVSGGSFPNFRKIAKKLSEEEKAKIKKH